MNFKFVYLLSALCLLRCQAFSLPLISSIFDGLSNEVDHDAEKGVPKQVPESFLIDLIDLSSYSHLLYGQPDYEYTGNLVAQLKPNETSVNPEELGSYFEGDILIPHKSLILKNGLSTKSYRWPNGQVPYEIADVFNANELQLIAFAMDEYHAKTCIRFTPRTWQRDYISFKRGNSGCWSTIGRIGGKQEVNLQAPGCLRKPGTVIHELMHVLGFLHEQNRQERDSYVNIQVENVQTYALPNFRKEKNTISFGVEYDYGSVLHYSPTAFSINGLPTIVSKKPTERAIMGQREGFSAKDIEKINRMYECKVIVKPPAPPVDLLTPAPAFTSLVPARAPIRFLFSQTFGTSPWLPFLGRFLNPLG